MITLSITLPNGSVASKTVSNAKGQAILIEDAEFIGATGTDEQKAQKIVEFAAKYLQDVAQSNKRRKRNSDADALSASDQAALEWS